MFFFSFSPLLITRTALEKQVKRNFPVCFRRVRKSSSSGKIISQKPYFKCFFFFTRDFILFLNLPDFTLEKFCLLLQRKWKRKRKRKRLLGRQRSVGFIRLVNPVGSIRKLELSLNLFLSHDHRPILHKTDFIQ